MASVKSGARKESKTRAEMKQSWNESKNAYHRNPHGGNPWAINLVLNFLAATTKRETLSVIQFIVSIRY